MNSAGLDHVFFEQAVAISVWMDSSEPSNSPACAALVLSSRGHALNKPGASGGSLAAGCTLGQPLWAPAAMWVPGAPGA